MIDLERQLEDYGTFHDQEWGPITTDFIEARDDHVVIINGPTSPTLPVGRRWLVALAAAAAVLVLVGGVALLFNLTGSETPPATSAQFWSRVPHDEAVFGGEGGQGIESVTVGGPGLVAVGWNEGNAAVWTSVDGITWSPVPHDETAFGGGAISMRSVTAGGPGLVAVGWDGGILDDDPDVDAAVWTSVDGITWSRVPHDEEVFGAAFMESVTAGGPGLVAVGMDGPWGDGDAAVWTSVDGFTWSRVPHDEEVFGGVDSQVMHDVTVGGPGLVAVGNDGGRGPWDNNAENNAAVWTSVDGVNWSRVPDDETVFSSGGNPVMLSVTAGGPGLVAVGADFYPANLAETAVWTSPDGVTWTRVPDDATVRGALTGVTAGGPGLVAVGDDGDALGVWTSVDGITWSRAPDDDAVFGGGGSDWISDVTVGGPGLVAVGTLGGDAAVWVSEED